MKKKAVVIHSGGMDSSICLALAIRDFGAPNVVSLTFSYHQRHQIEIERATRICQKWNVDQKIIDLSALQQLTTNALMDPTRLIECSNEGAPNTLVVGRNGLFATLGGIFAHSIGAHMIYMGIIGVESANSGYRDCTCEYMDLKEKLLQQDLADPTFTIRTPLVHMTKKETMDLAYQLGVLPYLLRETITCYEGIPLRGCRVCPACLLRNEGIDEFCRELKTEFQVLLNSGSFRTS